MPRSDIPVPADMQPLDPERDLLEGRQPVVARHRVEIVDADPIHKRIYEANHPVHESPRAVLIRRFNAARRDLRQSEPELHAKLDEFLDVVAGIINAGNFS